MSKQSKKNATPKPQSQTRRTLDALQRALLFFFSYWRLWLMLLLIIGIALLIRSFRDSKVLTSDEPAIQLAIEHDTAIDVTPEEIRKVKDIGEFEFLRIETEELAELSEHGVLSDKQLVRIYTGTLRIGFDLSTVPDDWFQAHGDTAILNVPRLRLLDTDFIDETRTRAFYEKGSWPAEARDRLYNQARRKMVQRCLMPENFAAARQSATELLSRIFLDMGYRRVYINYIY